MKYVLAIAGGLALWFLYQNHMLGDFGQFLLALWHRTLDTLGGPS